MPTPKATSAELKERLLDNVKDEIDDLCDPEHVELLAEDVLTAIQEIRDYCDTVESDVHFDVKKGRRS